MRQQINLHQPIFRRERKALSAVMVATTLGVLAVALTAFSVYTARGVERLQSEVAQLTEQQAKQQEQLAKVGETLSRQARRSDVEARVKALTTTLSERTQALQVLAVRRGRSDQRFRDAHGSFGAPARQRTVDRRPGDVGHAQHDEHQRRQRRRGHRPRLPA